jgi:hypothetical protein
MAGPMTEEGDARLIGSLAERGCDLSKSRPVGIHFNASSEAAAEAVASELEAEGWEPHIFALSGEWFVSGVGRRVVVSVESIAELRLSSEDLASRSGVTYYGWQADLDPGMDV